MNNNTLISRIVMNCPICDREHPVELRRRITQAIIKDEVVDYEEEYYLCPFGLGDENEFVPAGLMDENLLRARDAYRRKKGLLTANEISEIRECYNLTQNDFAAALGWGDITISRYETKLIQDETYDRMMRMFYENPLFALECIQKHKDRFTPEKYARIKEKINLRVVGVGNAYLKEREIIGRYVNYSEESDLNGYKTLDINKVANVTGYFSQTVPNLYKVKLMKLLWYADSVFFGRHGNSMTGLVYCHMPLGALPIAFDEIIYLPTVKVIEELYYDDITYRIQPNNEINLADFSLEEFGVLQTVAVKFRDFKAREIIDYMHKEIAYRKTQPNEVIPYSLACQLNELQ